MRIFAYFSDIFIRKFKYDKIYTIIRMLRRTLYLNKLDKFKDSDLIKVITGVRRSGKTCLLKQYIDDLKNQGIPEKNIIFISLESANFDFLKEYTDLNQYIFNKTANIKGKIYIFIDEIQMIDSWQKSVNSFRVDLDADIYITGSNSKILSGELATLIAGRYINIEVFPFSYRELLNYYSQKRDLTSKDEIDIFNQYITYGGFPGNLIFDDEGKIDYLNDIFNSIILKDIILRNKIKNIDFLERLIKFVISNIGQIFSINSIRKYLKHENISVSTNTLSNYLNNCLNAYLLLKASREEIKTKKILTINEKYYCIDPGFYRLKVGSKASMSQILENIVYLELIRKNYNVTVGNINNTEVDFICKRFDKTIYIQVSESIIDENTRNREFKSLISIKDNYPKYILTLDSFDYSKDGIIHKNIIDFLKEDNI